MLTDILLVILGLIVGLVIGFFLARRYTEKFLKENPPINEKMIEVMMSSMGRKPNQKQIRQVMNNLNRVNKK